MQNADLESNYVDIYKTAH